MALNTSRCTALTPLQFEGLILISVSGLYYRRFDPTNSTYKIRCGTACCTWSRCSSYSERVCTWRGLCQSAYVLPRRWVRILPPVGRDVVPVPPILRLWISGKILFSVFHVLHGHTFEHVFQSRIYIFYSWMCHCPIT